jgi:hypothetical protein
MSERSRKRRGPIGWLGDAVRNRRLVALFLAAMAAYPLSFGPVCWCVGYVYTNDPPSPYYPVWMQVIHGAYRPLTWQLYQCPKSVWYTAEWYLALYLPEGCRVSIGESGDTFGVSLSTNSRFCKVAYIDERTFPPWKWR